MAQITMTHDLAPASSLLRQHIEENIVAMETLLPDGAPLSVRIKKVSKHLFGAHLTSRFLGKSLVVRAYDVDVVQALNRARRHLIRQIGSLREQKRDGERHGRRRLGGVRNRW